MAWDFARELEKWGPWSSDNAVSLAAARAYCAHVAKTHYENFTVVSLLLPRRLIRHFHAVYAYCRWSDDLADETGGGQRAIDLIVWWRDQLRACYNGAPLTPLEGEVAALSSAAGGGRGTALTDTSDRAHNATGSSPARFLTPHPSEPKTVPTTSPSRGEVKGAPRHPVMIALRETIRRFDIPSQPFLDLLEAFTQDQHVKRYDTFDQLLGYCRNSANPVGRLVLMLFECFDEERGALSDEVCTGLQLANFWQDVARDLDIGRVYLPAEDRARFGYTDEDLEARRLTPQFRELMRFEVERARGYFDRGSKLLPLLPREARIDVDLFIRGGRAILSAIERIDFNVWSRRPEVSKWEKGKLLLGALARRFM